MKLDNLKILMNKMGSDLTDEIKKDIEKKKAIRTGKMKASIEYKLIEGKDSVSISILAIDYYKWVDEGTKFIKAREFTKDSIKRIMDKYENKIKKSVMEDIQDVINKKVYKK